MAQLVRSDGEYFVSPSYRDVLIAKQKNILKKDILHLSQNYGEYITLQKKSANQYEITFSQDPGYLLGETVWYYFKRPPDLIYCEIIPNTTEAILVIVKAGSVYLDGNFPIESISEELVIFLTEKNKFQIYLYGDVPISEEPEPGKFSFNKDSVASFTRLKNPVFDELPLLKIYQLQLVEIVLKKYGIGVFPLKPLLSFLILGVFIWMVWSYFSTPAPSPVRVVHINPYQLYGDLLTSPSPDEEIRGVLNSLQLFYALPGWQPKEVNYSNQTSTIALQSSGRRIESLMRWAEKNRVGIDLQAKGIFAVIKFKFPNRERPTVVYPLKNTIARLVDQLASVYPGNHLKLENFDKKDKVTTVILTIEVSNLSPFVIAVIADQLKNLPCVLRSVTFTMNDGSISGSIVMQAAGS